MTIYNHIQGVRAELIRQYHNLREKQNDIELSIVNVRKAYADTLPFKVGSYFEIDDRKGWIKQMVLDAAFERVYMDYSPVCEDGSPSNRPETFSISLADDLDRIKIKQDIKQTSN